MKARDGIYKARMVSTTTFLPSQGLRLFSGSPFFSFGLPFEAGEVFMSLLHFPFEVTYTLILPSSLRYGGPVVSVHILVHRVLRELTFSLTFTVFYLGPFCHFL
ncbi:hypothetical protein K443DRAFT_208134 [Laccaria amethystina LaAM-08-1]|uniref:Uncharacterized protein n=1 Tax=Laccaria amethystina LaAM-08-1 TaxID=1095629 RepID=A0A0C9WMT7_9AGAR|nr:hypothetical protein K443DRAFT_208134 [Laccaria amethystina LaAM-08-1]